MMLPCLLVFMPFLQIQTAPPSSLLGSWVNQNPPTDGLTEIVINNNESGHLQAHVSGKCEPEDCDWRVAEVMSWNGLARSVFDFGFSTTTIDFISLPDERLLVVYKSEYKNKCDHPDQNQDHVEMFVREKKAAQDSESVAAKVLLKKVAETFRSLSAARFESEQFVEHIDRQRTRPRTFSTSVISQPDKERVETIGSAEPKVVISNGETL